MQNGRAYVRHIELLEPRVAAIIDRDPHDDSLDFALRAWGKDRPVLLSGGYKSPASAYEAIEGQYKDYEAAVVFGRLFISTPDLVFRVKKDIALTPYDRSTFYKQKHMLPEPGYIDYPYSKEFIEEFGTPAEA